MYYLSWQMILAGIHDSNQFIAMMIWADEVQKRSGKCKTSATILGIFLVIIVDRSLICDRHLQVAPPGLVQIWSRRIMVCCFNDFAGGLATKRLPCAYFKVMCHLIVLRSMTTKFNLLMALLGLSFIAKIWEL